MLEVGGSIPSPPTKTQAKAEFGAGDGNRTRVNSLEGYRTTIVLHPLVVARAGFEPAISGLKGRRPSPLDERARMLPIIGESGCWAEVCVGPLLLPWRSVCAAAR